MTPADTLKLSPEESIRLGDEIYECRIKPTLTPEDDGKFVVIDLATGDYEIDPNEWDAFERLTAHRRGGMVRVIRINRPYRMSFRMMFGQ